MKDKQEFEVEPFYVKDLVLVFFHQWKAVGAIFATVIIFTALWLSSVDRVYRSSVVLSPVSSMNTSSGGISGAMGNLGALGSLVGVGGGQTTIFAEHLALMRSPELVRRLDEKHGLRKRFFSSLWDKEEQKWIPPSDIISSFKRGIKSLLGYPDWSAPGHVALQAAISSKLAVHHHSNGTELRRVEWAHTDPAFSAQMLAWLIEEANTILREQKMQETQEQIAFLTKRLDEVRSNYHRETLAQLLLEQERMNMLLQAPSGPGARIFDPIVTPPTPVFPKVTMTFLLALFAGGMTSLLFVYFKMNGLNIFRK